MAGITELFPRARHIEHHRPWPRLIVDRAGWRQARAQLVERHWSMLGLWGEPDVIHLAVLDNASDAVAVISLDCPEGRFPSIADRHPPASRFERAIRDLVGLRAENTPDRRPWLVHEEDYAFLPAEGEGLHQIPVGPVHAGIIEPGHFRFTVNGETVVRLEERLGYVHRGIETLMTGASLERGLTLAGRCSGDSTVAYSLAFARACEAALEIEAPPRAVWLRALMAEIERIANHLGDIGAICNDASFPMLQAHFSALREHCLRAADRSFGHRLMRDVIAVGGVARDLTSTSPLRSLLGEIRSQLPRLVDVYDETASLQDRTVSTGVLKPELARQFAAGGFVGRASGRSFDARKAVPYPPYDTLTFEVPRLDAGDVNARAWLRIKEIEQSLGLIDQILDRLPSGPLAAERAERSGEGMALVEGFRGDVLVWLSLDGRGRIGRCHLRDPSWFQWPLLEAAIEGNIVADFPLCNKSFNCSYAGHDL